MTKPKVIKSVEVMNPEGLLEMGPMSYQIVGINVDVAQIQKEFKWQRSLLRRPAEVSKAVQIK